MSIFDDKEQAVESKYAHDKETEFKMMARRNKLLGQWAAEQLHYEGEKAASYAKEVVMADFEEPGDDDVLRKGKQDFDAAGLDIDEKVIREQMVSLLVTAREQVTASS